MTVDELIEQLFKISDLNGGDLPVCVRVTNCLSSHTSVHISGIGVGFDWEKGRVMIGTDDPIERTRLEKLDE